MRRLAFIPATALLTLGLAGGPSQAPTVRTVASRLAIPWGLTFLPNGDALVSERNTGRILRVPKKGGRVRMVMRLAVSAQGYYERGLLGLAVSPRYSRD